MNKMIQKQIDALEREFKKPYPDEIKQIFELKDSKQIQIKEVRFSFPKDPLEMSEAGFEFEYKQNDDSTHQIRKCKWYETLEEELLKRGIQVVSLKQEALRCGYHLRSNLKTSDILYGKSLTNITLRDFIEERFGDLPPIKNIVEQIKHFQADENPNSSDCQNYIKSCINGLGNSLVWQLKYNNNEAFQILVGAVTYLLDQRYSISISKAFFENR